MAGGSDVPVYKKDIVHNLGYKPIVRAFVYIKAHSVNGLREVPINYYISEYVEDMGRIILDTRIYYEHIDNNTIRFYGQQNTTVQVTLYIEPREDAWYE